MNTKMEIILDDIKNDSKCIGMNFQLIEKIQSDSLTYIPGMRYNKLRNVRWPLHDGSETYGKVRQFHNSVYCNSFDEYYESCSNMYGKPITHLKYTTLNVQHYAIPLKSSSAAILCISDPIDPKFFDSNCIKEPMIFSVIYSSSNVHPKILDSCSVNIRNLMYVDQRPYELTWDDNGVVNFINTDKGVFMVIVLDKKETEWALKDTISSESKFTIDIDYCTDTGSSIHAYPTYTAMVRSFSNSTYQKEDITEVVKYLGAYYHKMYDFVSAFNTTTEKNCMKNEFNLGTMNLFIDECEERLLKLVTYKMLHMKFHPRYVIPF